MPQTKVKKTTVKKAKNPVKTGLTADVFNASAEKAGKITLPEDVFAKKVSPSLIATSVRVYLINQRQGTRKAKTRSEVIGSTRKIFRQKGTGKARHGDIKAPIFIGGGVAHGPKVTEFKKSMSQKMRRQALCGALSEKYSSGQIKFVSSLDGMQPKTKNMVRFLNKMSPVEKNKKLPSVLLITAGVNKKIVMAGRNIPNLFIFPVNQINTYQVMKYPSIIMAKDAVDYFTGPKKTSGNKKLKS